MVASHTHMIKSSSTLCLRIASRLIVIGCLLLGACGGGSSGENTGGSTGQITGGSGGDSSEPQVNNDSLACNRNIENSSTEQLRWVAANMCDYYLFDQQVPEVDMSIYDDMQSLIEDLRVLPFDRFSYVADAAQSTALFNAGETFGYGYRLTRLEPEIYRFSLIYRDSPIALAGVQRGEELVAIDGVTLVGNPDVDFAALLGTGTDPKTTEFAIRNSAGDTRTVTVTRALYRIQTVHNAAVMDTGSTRTGYLNLLHFFEPTSAELATAFALFSEQNVDDLVLDLRFNGGGRTRVAAELASYIAGDAFAGQVFSRLRFNERYAQLGVQQEMSSLPDALSLSRVVILTTRSSCSASEMVINGLRPFIDVVTIGSTTCGKPYGTRGRERFDKVMHALEVEFVNADDVGGYFDGLPATCSSGTDLTVPLGNSTEALLAAGLFYLNSNTCQVQAASRTATAIGNDNPANPFDDEYRFTGQ